MALLQRGLFGSKGLLGSTSGASSWMERKRQELEEAQYTPEELKKKKEEEEGKGRSNIAKVGHFFKEAALDVKDSAVGTWQGFGDIGRGVRGGESLDEITDEQMEMTKRHSQEMRDILGDAESAKDLKGDKKKQWDEYVKRSNKEREEFKARTEPARKEALEDMDTLQNLDEKKLAFQAADTALNVLTLGVTSAPKAVAKQGIKVAVKSAMKQAVKTGGTEVLEQLIKEGGEQAVKQIVKEGGESLLKKMAKGAAKDALLGAGYGVTQTGKRNPDAEWEDFAKGVAIGGTLGGVAGAVTPAIGAAYKKVRAAGVEKKTAQAMAKETDRLAAMTPDEYASEMGVTVEQAKTELADMATSSVEQIVDKGIKAKLNKVFSPVSNFGERTKQAFKRNAGGRYSAESQRRAVVQELKEAAELSGQPIDFDTALQIEAGTAPDNAFTQKFREIADKTRQEAVDSGLDIGYRDNYVPHIWEKSAEEVDKLARGAGMKPRAGFERVIPTYQEGLELGLKPKYKNPADMMGDYVKNLETTRTNVALLTDLRQQGLIKSGRPQAGWKTITAEGFPRTAEGNQLTAPREVARVLNNLYGTSDSFIDKALAKTAKLNSTWQDIALAGGIPHTPANFFTLSQIFKETALGLGQTVTGSPIKGAKTIYSPLAAFVRSFSQKETDKFVAANQGFIDAMAKRGVPLRFAESTAGRSATETVRDAFRWDKLFNEPTFGRFMPNLQLNTGKNTFNALSKKMGREEAMDVTAEIMKKMYGITDELATGRSQAVQDAIGTIAFAPKYRESIVNVLANTVRSLNPKNFGDKSYSLNRRLAVGMGVTYMIYDQLNRATTGHGLGNNPEGKELQLAIPYGGKDEDGNQKVVYIPFMPSFMTLPRAAVGAVQSAVKGDVKGVTSETGKLLSMPVQTISQLASNKDYFGRPIVIDEEAARAGRVEEDSPFAQLRKRLGYVAGQASPALPRAAMQAAGGKPLEQVAATALEAPVRFGEFSDKSDRKASYSPSQVTGDWFKIYNPKSAKRRAVSAEVTKLIKDGKVGEAKRKAQEFNESLAGSFSNYYEKYGDNPNDDPMWDEMLEGLSIKTSDRAFAIRAKQ